MDATRKVVCNSELFNPVLTTSSQASFILTIAHCFQLVFKPLGQPAPIAQILSGLALGSSGLSNIPFMKKVFFQDLAGDYYDTVALLSRIIIMFLMGLETDVPYLIRNLRPATVIAMGGCIVCSIFAVAITPFIYQETGSHGSMIIMGLIIGVILSNAAYPIVVRLAVEMKFATTDIGRLAMSSSLLSDVYAVFLLVISSRQKHGWPFMLWVLAGCGAMLLVLAVVVLNMYLANWLNRRNRNQKHLKSAEAFGILSLVVVTAMALELMGFCSITACFVIGSMFPRGGKTTRTLLPKLSYSVHNFIFPIYLGYVGFQADINAVNSLTNLGIVVIIILLSLGGKISGTLAACYYLKIPFNEGVLFAFLMNVKGHADLVALSLSIQSEVVTGSIFYSLMVLAIAINTLIVGPIISFIARRENATISYGHITLEWQDPDVELPLLACVHNPRHVTSMFGLISALRGSEEGPIVPHLMHLIELPEKNKSHLLYNQREDDELSDEDSYGGDDVLEINEAVDNFYVETAVLVNQLKTVSPFQTMYSDVCDRAEDLRASIILLHFHKHQRIDGKMETGKEGIRTTNQKVLRHAKCAVAILVDRGLSGRSSCTAGSESLQHVATLFFGGADDREALGFCRRLSMHHHISLTLVRFLPASFKRRKSAGFTSTPTEGDVVMTVSDQDDENEADTAALTEFYTRNVTTGQVGYLEKYVENGTETASVLREISETYSLFVVGKGRRGNLPMTVGISDWEECPELGTVGDFLASSDFDISGSVLVIQQHRHLGEDER